MIERGTLWDTQVNDLTFHFANARSANLSDPGAGKTPPTCAWISGLWTAVGVRTCWAMPKSLLKKNLKELIKFSEFHPTDVAIYDGTPKKLAQILESNPKVLLMGFDRFVSDWTIIKKRYPDFDAVCVDEIHMGFSTDGSKRTQELYLAMKYFRYFLPMTGTLIDGRLDSVYPTISIIEPRYYASRDSFMTQHAVYDWYGKLVAWKGHDKIKAILDRHTVRHTFREVHGDQTPDIIPERVEMSPKQRAAYDEWDEKAMLELEDAFLATDMPGVAAIRARQIMSHPEALPHPSGLGTFSVMEGSLTGKDEALLIHLENHKRSGKPLVIFAAFIAEQERILRLVRKHGMTGELINGNVSPTKRGQLDLDFQAGKFQVMVGSPETAAVGFNWGHVDHVIFTSFDYKDSSFAQAFKRMIRGKRAVTLWVTVLEYENSIDQRILTIVQTKSENAHAVDDTYDVLVLTPPKPKIILPVKGFIVEKPRAVPGQRFSMENL